MKRFRQFLYPLLLLGLAISVPARAELVQQMNLDELINNSGAIYRGTILDAKSGSVEAGGSELPTVTYVILVSELVKGQPANADPKMGMVVELTMLGRLKPVQQDSGNIRRFESFLSLAPKLEIDKEYLLFTTQPSSVGLSMTVGVGQGTFKFLGGDMVVNEVDNIGLFRDLDRGAFPESGPIDYAALVERMRQKIQNSGE